jgi:hypothetical protein
MSALLSKQSIVAGTVALMALSTGMSHLPIDAIAVCHGVKAPTTSAPYDEDDPVRVDVDLSNADGNVFALSLLKNGGPVSTHVENGVVAQFMDVPRSVNDKLNDPKVQKAIDKGMKYLGNSP